MAFSKDPFTEEVASISDKDKSPESLAKTKDGSTFAAKARAAELNATRARKAIAKHALLLTDDDDNDNDVPPLAPVSLGSFTFTRSRSRASNARNPPNNLTELPGVTAEIDLKSPSPQHHSFQLPQPSSRSPHTFGTHYLNQYTSCPDSSSKAAYSNPGGDHTSVSTAKYWQGKVNSQFSPDHHHKPSNPDLGHNQPRLQRHTQAPNPPESNHSNRASTSAEKPYRCLEQTITPKPRQILPQASRITNNPKSLNSPRRTPASPSRQSIQDSSSESTIAPILRRSLQQASSTTDYSQSPVPTLISSHIDETPALGNRQGVLKSSFKPTIAPIPRRSLPQASPTINNSQPPDSPPQAPDQNHAAVNFNTTDMYPDLRATPYAQSQGRTISPSPENVRILALYQRAISNSQSPLRSQRDPRAYSNPNQASNMLRTVAHDPFARPPTTTKVISAASKSTLKPEAAVYTPRPVGEKWLEANISPAKPPVLAEGTGNEAMATFLKRQKRESNEDIVRWFRSGVGGEDVGAVKMQLERQEEPMTTSLAGDSVPDDSLNSRLPKPIGHGRPSTRKAAPTTTPGPQPPNERFDSKGMKLVMANTIANFKQHEHPARGDYCIRYRNAHGCEVDQRPEGNKSLFDPAWGTPPSRVARDPRRIQSGGVTGAFGRR